MQYQRRNGGIVEKLVTWLGAAQLAVLLAHFFPGIDREWALCSGRQRDTRRDLPLFAGLDREQRRGGYHPHVAGASILIVTIHEVNMDIPVAVVGNVVPFSGRAEFNRLAAIDRPDIAPFRQADLMDKADALRVLRPQGQNDPGIGIDLCLQRQLAHQCA